MNEYVKPPQLDAGRFDPDCAESSWTLPSHWYFDAEIFAREEQEIFARSWCYQCHHSEISAAGDYHGRVGRQSVILRRDSRGELHARCHGRPAAAEVYAGFVFVNLDKDAAPLRTQAGKLIDDIYACCPRVDELIPVRRIERAVAANWKTVIDNNHECYHCALNHKSLMRLVDYANRADWSDDGITFSHRVQRRQGDNGAYRLERGEQESLFAFIWPSCIPLWFPGTPGAVLFQVVPSGPETCILRHDFYFLDKNPSRQEEDFMRYIERVLVAEDLALCEAVQRGLHSMGYRQGKFIVDRDKPEYSEHHVHFFQRLVYRALTGE